MQLPFFNAQRALRISLWLLLIPFLLFLYRVYQDVYNIKVSPDSEWPFWLRITVKSIIMIVIPFAASIINFLAKPLKLLNIIIAIVSLSVGLSFTVVQIIDN
jgi:hypothetical protein